MNCNPMSDTSLPPGADYANFQQSAQEDRYSHASAPAGRSQMDDSIGPTEIEESLVPIAYELIQKLCEKFKRVYDDLEAMPPLEHGPQADEFAVNRRESPLKNRLETINILPIEELRRKYDSEVQQNAILQRYLRSVRNTENFLKQRLSFAETLLYRQKDVIDKVRITLEKDLCEFNEREQKRIKDCKRMRLDHYWLTEELMMAKMSLEQKERELSKFNERLHSEQPLGEEERQHLIRKNESMKAKLERLNKELDKDRVEAKTSEVYKTSMENREREPCPSTTLRVIQIGHVQRRIEEFENILVRIPYDEEDYSVRRITLSTNTEEILGYIMDQESMENRKSLSINLYNCRYNVFTDRMKEFLESLFLEFLCAKHPERIVNRFEYTLDALRLASGIDTLDVVQR